MTRFFDSFPSFSCFFRWEPVGMKEKVVQPWTRTVKTVIRRISSNRCVCGFCNSDFWLLPLWGLLNHWVVFLATFVAANIEKCQTPNLMHRNRNPFFYLPPPTRSLKDWWLHMYIPTYLNVTNISFNLYSFEKIIFCRFGGKFVFLLVFFWRILFS